MDIVLRTSDPDSVDADEIRAAVEGLGYFVLSVTKQACEMLAIPARHIKSGHVGEIQQIDRRIGLDGLTETRYYFEDHARPTVAGWYPGSHLRIGV